MYEIVKSKRQQQKFADTWEYFCKKYGWYNDPYAENGTRYNLLHKERVFSKKRVIGTIEFIPYVPGSPTSTVDGNGKANFYQYDVFKQNKGEIWEIDKLCIQKDFQKSGYFHLFYRIIIEHADKKSPQYYLSLMEKKLFRMLKLIFGSFVEQKGEQLLGPTTALIPTVIHIGKMTEVWNSISTQSNDSVIINSSYNKDVERILKLALYYKLIAKST